jgi:hypothetical protein
MALSNQYILLLQCFSNRIQLGCIMGTAHKLSIDHTAYGQFLHQNSIHGAREQVPNPQQLKVIHARYLSCLRPAP